MNDGLERAKICVKGVLCVNLREQQKIETKARIAKAVYDLSKIYGIENLKVREICKEADISIGTFYNYYDTIQSLIIERIVDVDVQRKSELANLLTDENEVVNMERYIRKQVEDFRSVPTSLLKEVFRIFIFYPEADVLKVNRTAFDIIHGMVSRGQEKGQITKTMEASKMTKLILKLIIGNCFVNCMHPEIFDFSQMLVDEVNEIIRIKD